jgi:hypothetical protein
MCIFVPKFSCAAALLARGYRKLLLFLALLHTPFPRTAATTALLGIMNQDRICGVGRVGEREADVPYFIVLLGIHLHEMSGIFFFSKNKVGFFKKHNHRNV